MVFYGFTIAVFSEFLVAFCEGGWEIDQIFIIRPYFYAI